MLKITSLNYSNSICSINFVKNPVDNCQKMDAIEGHSKKNNDKTSVAIVGMVLVTSTVLALVGKMTKSTYFKALKKQGVEIKDEIAYLVNSKEKFTGSIKWNSKPYGAEKNIVNFDNGVIQEQLIYGLLGKEKSGEFYKDGKKVLQVYSAVSKANKEKGVEYCINNDATKPLLFEKTDSPFEWARNKLKDINVK